MTDANKLTLVQEIFNKYKTDDIYAVWTDGYDEVVIFTDGRNFTAMDEIINAVVDLFDLNNASLSGGPLLPKYKERFKSKEGSYYVE